ncbi:MAG: hypothetical protein C0596_18030 [Marinilabiliales bacterium]|nr:MAG: hypothetical protein C0596_18030 [Marinilabiliales bacterium]
MKIMNLKLHPKSTSKALATNYASLVEVLILMGVGALAIILRAKLRIPINIPGHHGVEVMALIIAGRSLSNFKPASTISTLAASILILFPFMGFKDPFLPAIYITMGLTIDFLFVSFEKFRKNIVFLALLGGVSYMIIPLSRLLINLTTGYPYNSLLKHGIIAKIALHLTFGMFGALLGAGISMPFIRKKQ